MPGGVSRVMPYGTASLVYQMAPSGPAVSASGRPIFDGESLQNSEDQLERPVALGLWSIAGGFILFLELRKKGRENGAQRSQHLGDCFTFAPGDSKSKRVHERRVRH